MKKGLIILASALLFSCQRDYSCTCERENFGGFIQESTFEFSERSESRADQICTDPNWDKCTLTKLD